LSGGVQQTGVVVVVEEEWEGGKRSGEVRVGEG
jgi:hypothetical protein